MANSTPYYLFGAQRRYPFAWHGGAGGVPQQNIRSAEAQELSDFDLLESGLTPYSKPFPALSRTRAHATNAMGDWPLYRPAGPEPLDPNQLAGVFDLSSNEKKLAVVVALGALALVVSPRLRRRIFGASHIDSRGRYRRWGGKRSSRRNPGSRRR